MAKTVHDDVLDGALNIIKNNCVNMSVCNAQPTTRTHANETYMLGKVTMTSGDFTVADGDTSGRKVTVAAKTSISVTNSGTATYFALYDATRLLYVTTCTSQVLVAGNLMNTNAWDIEIADPT
jgi:hypothetical protein